MVIKRFKMKQYFFKDSRVIVVLQSLLDHVVKKMILNLTDLDIEDVHAHVHMPCRPHDPHLLVRHVCTYARCMASECFSYTLFGLSTFLAF